MTSKYNNPRLFNTVLTGPGMTHPRNPHVVIGSDTKGFVLGDLMDANAIMETIDQKIDEVIDGADSDHDTLKEIETDLNTAKTKLSTIETGAQVNPTKLSAFENDLQHVPAPQIGDYLYSDFTWGTSSEAAIGICVGTADMFEDGKARFCQLEVSSSTYLWSTENVDTPLPNVSGVSGDNPIQIIDVTNDTYDGISNTNTLITLGENKYLAAAYAKTTFNNNGYLPTAKEFLACKENIPSTIISNNYIWCSSESSSSQAWYWDKTFNSIQYYSKSSGYKVLGFYAVDPMSSEYTFRYITTTDLATYITTTDLATEEKAGLMSSELCAVLNDIYHDSDSVLAIGTNTKVDGSLEVQDGITLLGGGMTVEGDTDTVTLTGEDFVQLKQLISNG